MYRTMKTKGIRKIFLVMAMLVFALVNTFAFTTMASAAAKKIAVVNTVKDADTANLIKALNACGAEAVFVSSAPKASKYDGLAIPGGGDVNPALFGGVASKSVNVNKARDTLQINAIQNFVSAKKPILGICRGSQLLNVHFGGTLKQDISGHKNGVYKKITIDTSSYFYKTYGKSENVIHYHHQCCRKMGTNLVATMKCDDGVIEGFQHKTLPIYGLQWHPELMGSTGYKALKRFLAAC